MGKSEVMPRNMRRVRAYATDNGDQPLKSRRIENVAPKLQGLQGAAAAAPSSSSAAANAWLPSDATLASLKAVKRNVLSKMVRKTAATVANTVAAAAIKPAADAAAMPMPSALPRLVRIVSPDEHAFSVALGVADCLPAAAGPIKNAAAPSVVVACLDAAVASGIAEQLVHLFGVDKENVGLVRGDVKHPKKAEVVVGSIAAFAKINSGFMKNAAVVIIVVAAALPSSSNAVRVSAESRADVAAFTKFVQDNCVAVKHTVVIGQTLRHATLSELIPASAEAEDKNKGLIASSSSADKKNVKNVEISYFTANGPSKFNILNTLVKMSGEKKKIVVHFCTKQVASFYCDAFFALQCPCTLLCDVEDAGSDKEKKGDADNTAKHLPPSVALDRVSAEFNAAEGGAVLFSAFGLVPSGAEVFLQFDAPAKLDTFPRFLAQSVLSLPKMEHAMMVFDPTHVAGAIGWLKKAAETSMADGETSVALRFKQLTVPGAAANLLQGNKLKSICKKLFTINNKAYEAFRSAMMFYSLLRPRSVYDVTKLHLQSKAEEFGMDDAPLLDLRTKKTEFRPKEDYYKIAQHKDLLQARKDKAYAIENLQAPEISEEGW